MRNPKEGGEETNHKAPSFFSSPPSLGLSSSTPLLLPPFMPPHWDVTRFVILSESMDLASFDPSRARFFASLRMTTGAILPNIGV
jgi:hypothetical protein